MISKTLDLINNQKVVGKKVKKLILAAGINQPPQNKIIAKKHIKIILVYSAIKKKANPIDAYSTLYPATNSASASGKSKGGLDVSAKDEIKNNKKTGNKGKTNHMFSCIAIIVVRFSDLLNITTVNTNKDKDISYEII